MFLLIKLVLYNINYVYLLYINKISNQIYNVTYTIKLLNAKQKYFLILLIYFKSLLKKLN